MPGVSVSGVDSVADRTGAPLGPRWKTTRQAAPFLGGPGHQPLATEMNARWTRFIKTGDAGWPRYDTATRPTMRFDTTSAVVNDPLVDRRQIWAGARFN